jgi:outer membrane protein assembly factor BamB
MSSFCALRRTAVPLATVLLVVCVTSSQAAARGDRTLWTTSFDLNGRIDRAADSATTPDGSIIAVTGSTHPVGRGHANVLTTAFSTTDGSVVWSRRFGSPRVADHGTAISISEDGTTTAVAALSSLRDGTAVWRTIVYSTADGVPVWHRRVAELDATMLAPEGVFVGDDEVLVVGNAIRASEGGFPIPALMVSYDRSDGSIRWREAFEPHRWTGSQPGAIVHSSSYDPVADVVYLGLQVDETPDQNSMGVLAVDADSGARLWRSWFVSPGGELGAHPSAMALAPDGSTVYIGGTFDCCSIRYLLAFATADGTLRWSRDISSGSTGLSALATSPDGAHVFGGGEQHVFEGDDVELPFTFSVTANDGSIDWKRRFRSDTQSWVGAPQYVAVSPDGASLYVTTSRMEVFTDPDLYFGPADILTIAYESGTGHVQWSDIFGGVETDESPVSIDAFADEVVVCGTGGSAESHADQVCISLMP